MGTNANNLSYSLLNYSGPVVHGASTFLHGDATFEPCVMPVPSSLRVFWTRGQEKRMAATAPFRKQPP